MSTAPVVLTHQGWATVAFLKLVQEGLVTKDKQGHVRTILAPLFEKAERNAFDHAIQLIRSPKEPTHENPPAGG